jgi:hypothetical protein
VSKLAFFFMTLVGAVPAGGALYALIRNLLDRADSLGTVLLAITITATVCVSMVVLTPFIVLVFYKDERDPAAIQAQKEGAAAAPTDADKAEETDGFGDAIPDDFDEDELAATSDDEEYGEFDDDAEAFDDDDLGDYDEEYEEFDEDEEL